MAVLCIVQGCPVFNDIGPYFSLLATDAKASISSIYRGANAERLLNAHGKHSQRQLSEATPAERSAWGVLGTPNLPGFSTHELFSDGVAFANVLRGRRLAWWQQGVDVADADTERMIGEASGHGWRMFRPYGSGVEYHHLCFAQRPSPTPHTIKRIYQLRHSLPRS